MAEHYEGRGKIDPKVLVLRHCREEKYRKAQLTGGKEGFRRFVDANKFKQEADKLEHAKKSEKGSVFIRRRQKVQVAGLDEDSEKEPRSRDCETDSFTTTSTPISEETGCWVPVSSTLPKVECQSCSTNFSVYAGYLPGSDTDRSHFIGEDKELTLWDVVIEMLYAVGGKAKALTSGGFHQGQLSGISSNFLEQAWKKMAQTLTEATVAYVQKIAEAEPPRRLPDSSASACMLCSVRFHPIMCSRHHCRFCGGVFCSECSKGKSLLPMKFRVSDPQRVCNVCCVRLESVQGCLMDQVSRAAQLSTHDLTDLSTLRSWLNFPWGQSMENEIYRATKTLRGYNKVRGLSPVGVAILKQAKGLAILTVATVGTYKVGTGLVVARRKDGSWSAPSTIASLGLSWGAQAECTEFMIILRTAEALKMIGGDMHVAFGARMTAVVGAGDGGAFARCSLESNILSTRAKENSRFYGISSLKGSDILLGTLPRPRVASKLYTALRDLYQKLERNC